jgi:hypothetical protein
MRKREHRRKTKQVYEKGFRNKKSRKDDKGGENECKYYILYYFIFFAYFGMTIRSGNDVNEIKS